MKKFMLCLVIMSYFGIASNRVLANEASEQPIDEIVLLLEKEDYTIQPGDSLYRIAQKHNTTVEVIKKSNGLKSDVIHAGKKLKLLKGSFEIAVDKSDNILQLLLADRLVKEYAVATGQDNGTPVGDFKVINKLVDPTWYKSGAVVPPESSENELGTRWIGINQTGYGIHGTIKPESIGKQDTAGCVRMLNRDVEELYALIPVGTKVAIAD